MPRTQHEARRPGHIDHSVAARLRVLRTARGLTLAQLAAILSVSVAQLQKYEAGKNRVGASRVHEFAAFFQVPVSYFFSEGSSDRALSDPDAELLRVPGALELLEVYTSTPDPRLRRKILALVKATVSLQAAATNAGAADS